MGAREEAVVAAPPRIHREDCKRTKHGPQFSKWQVLVGPSDWEDHSLGKEGVARYRVHNLPTITSPGVYELGIAVSPNAKIDSNGVVVVYLGQADNVRTRLQCYGRSGAHLNKPNHCGLKREPGYFEDIFSSGYPIVYRWVPMKSKADALKVEAQLLDRFDYAWNKGSNGARRHADVLRKLNKVPSSNIQFPKFFRKILRFSQKPVGIEIQETKLLSPGQKFDNYADEKINNFVSRVVKFSKSHPKLVLDRQGAGDRHLIIKGFISKSYREGKLQVENADLEPSISGNREFDYHSAHSSVFDPVKLPVAAEKCPISESFSEACGVVLDDGSLCIKQPAKGNKRCKEHKGRKTYRSDSKSRGTSSVADVVFDSCDSKTLNYNKKNSSESGKAVFSKRSEVNQGYNNICGEELGDGYFSTNQLVNGNFSRSDAKGNTHVYGEGSNSSTFDDRKYGSSVCGARILSGSYCTRPVKGNTSCWQHSAQVSDLNSTISSCNDWKYGGTSLCGAPTQNGSLCRRQVEGGGRCWQHPVRAQVYGGLGFLPSLHVPDEDSSISSHNDWKHERTSLCGAPTRKGSYCKRQVKGGGTCWQH
ncbi:hypothetical protein ACOSP7_015203 [Xanthoceras sorbifolium]|uniref:Protein EFFECTOR OF TRANSCRIPTION 2-like n=1 Tax=Xanthoceras sorbifolium TaxID=99658 RepID=A0ABQ8I6S4_9ROSI|nr:hypothetical protein JRO89_XS04G0213000 [Xanthoceras sorbifolium]